MSTKWLYAAFFQTLLIITTASTQINLDMLDAGMSTRSRGAIIPSRTSDLPLGNASAQSAFENHLNDQAPHERSIETDNYIDEQRYYMGPGDELTIYLWGTANRVLTVVVNGEGIIAIPTVGIVNSKNLTFAETKAKLTEMVLKVFKKVEVSIALTKVRIGKSYITGDIVVPGSYAVSGITRVYDLIEMAKGFSPLLPNVYHRKIIIQNDLYPPKNVDIAQFLHNNDLSKNPYIAVGDRVVVTKMNQIISIYGCVNYPGTYDYLPGDRLVDILKAAGRYSRGADSLRITVTRFVDDKDSIKLSPVSMDDTLFALEPDDRIMVPGIPDYREHRQVILRGEVKYPGTYPIQRDKTHLRDIVDLAGGFTIDADLSNCKIIRKDTIWDVSDREYERLRNVPPDVLVPTEKTYLKARLTEERGRVSIDFSSLSSSEKANIVLRDGDEILVPCKSLMVKVSGGVIKPGFVSFRPGASWKYYVEQVGGFSDNAQHKACVMKSGSNMFLETRSSTIIEAGDMVLIPEKDPQYTMRITKDVLVVVSTIASTIIAAVTLATLMKQ